MSTADKLRTAAENVEKVWEAGKKAEYDAFWDNFQNYGERIDYQEGYCGVGWNDNNFCPKYDMRPNNVASMFKATKISDLSALLKKCGVTLDTSNVVRADGMFQYSSNIVVVPQISVEKVSYITNFASYATKLKTVEKMVLNQSGNITLTNAFNYCSELENITIDGVIGRDINFQWSTLLTHDSLMSIINALKDYSADTSGTVHTVTLGAENIAKLSAEEIDIIEQKGWQYG